VKLSSNIESLQQKINMLKTIYKKNRKKVEKDINGQYSKQYEITFVELGNTLKRVFSKCTQILA